MNITKNLLISLIFTFWILVVATFSIQNIDLVSLKFFFLESIKIPVGVLLSLTLGLGFIFGAILPIFFTSKKKKVAKTNRQNTFVYQREEEVESDPIFDWE
jgi:uncharacterized integral membrane protein